MFNLNFTQRTFITKDWETSCTKFSEKVRAADLIPRNSSFHETRLVDIPMGQPDPAMLIAEESRHIRPADKQISANRPV